MKNPKKFTFIDLFAGIGGFRLIMEEIGGHCVFSSEFDKKSVETYLKNFGETPSGDINKIKTKEIPDHDVLCAGFPCQAFSRSGKTLGFEDTRGTLFFEILRIAKDKKPKVLFLENVSNLKSHDQGRTFKIMKKSLEKIGYQVSEEIFNAKDFGLAQSRERIIIVASKKKFDFSAVKKVNKKVKIKDIEDKSGEVLKPEEYTIIDKSLWKEQKSGLIFCGYLNKAQRKTGVLPGTEHLSRVHKQPNRIYHVRGIHPTLSSQEVSGRFWVYDGKVVRKLSIKDCYRLQGFPKSFKIHSVASSAYRQVGNSVPLNLIRAVASEIKNQLLKLNS